MKLCRSLKRRKKIIQKENVPERKRIVIRFRTTTAHVSGHKGKRDGSERVIIIMII